MKIYFCTDAEETILILSTDHELNLLVGAEILFYFIRPKLFSYYTFTNILFFI